MFESVVPEIRLLVRGKGIQDRLKLLGLSARWHLEAQGLGLRHPERTTVLRVGEGHTVILRRNDYSMLLELIGLKSYEFDLGSVGEVGSVLDLGANIGLATVQLAQRFPQARFVCVEPAGSSYSLLGANLSLNNVDALSVRAAALGVAGDVAVVEGAHPDATTTRPATQTDGNRIRGATVAELLDEAGIDVVDLMKVDIEGAEAGLFEHAGEWAGRVRAVVAEIHSPLTVPVAASLLARHGYRQIPVSTGPTADVLLVVR